MNPAEIITGAVGGLTVLLAVSDTRRYRIEQFLYAIALSARGYARAARLVIGLGR